ncbi:MAG TPA: hypothetical protein VM011_09530 [Gammaproteobacteria bacterium]|nr:hypothetical protein [Gammaproteobacteria bacterium]
MILAHLPAVPRNPMFSLILGVCLLLLQSTATADVYKWVNENNEVQYTQMQPPPGISYVRIQTNEHPGTLQAQSDADAEEEAPAGKADSGKSASQSDAEARAEYEAEVAKISKQNCTIARNNLAQLNMGGHLRYRNDAGEYITMGEEERQKRIGEANKQIEMFCKKETK